MRIIKYTAAVKTSTLDSTSKTLLNLSGIFKKDPKLPLILKAPTLSAIDKSQIVQELLRHTGGTDKGDTVKNFLKTLAENNRLGILEVICDKFSTLMGAARGELDLTVTSASVCTFYLRGVVQTNLETNRNWTVRPSNGWRLRWQSQTSVRVRN